jgi:hypothetical protein
MCGPYTVAWCMCSELTISFIHYLYPLLANPRFRWMRTVHAEHRPEKGRGSSCRELLKDGTCSCNPVPNWHALVLHSSWSVLICFRYKKSFFFRALKLTRYMNHAITEFFLLLHSSVLAPLSFLTFFLLHSHFSPTFFPDFLSPLNSRHGICRFHLGTVLQHLKQPNILLFHSEFIIVEWGNGISSTLDCTRHSTSSMDYLLPRKIVAKKKLCNCIFFYLTFFLLYPSKYIFLPHFLLIFSFRFTFFTESDSS